MNRLIYNLETYYLVELSHPEEFFIRRHGLVHIENGKIEVYYLMSSRPCYQDGSAFRYAEFSYN